MTPDSELTGLGFNVVLSGNFPYQLRWNEIPNLLTGE